MRLVKAIAGALALGSAVLSGGTALATPVEFALTLTATALGNNPGPILGFSALPANPFVGTFSVDSSQLAPNQPFFFAPLLSFNLSIGTQAFTDPPINTVEIETDATGAIDGLVLADTVGTVQLNIDFNDLAIDEGWSAWDHSNLPDECGVSGIGGCIAGFGPLGTPGLIAVERIPEPPALALFAIGLAGLGAMRWRRRTNHANALARTRGGAGLAA